MTEELKELLNKNKAGEISDRQIISKVKSKKSLQEEIIKLTDFLDVYESEENHIDIIERLYYLVKGLTEPVKCKFCDNKANWFGRGLKEGYRETCKNKECQSKLLSEKKQGSKSISQNRDKEFIEWQASVTTINDDIVKEHIKYDKFIPMINNPIILDYLNNRFPDSASTEETLQRIEMGVERKPICARPGCNNPVTWVGRKRELYTRYCCPACSAQSEETREKNRQTNIEHWGTENCYDSSVYQQKVIEQYGVAFHTQRPEVIAKKKETFIKKYGVEFPTQLPEIKEKMMDTTEKHYGVRNMFLHPDVIEKSRSEETRKKIQETWLEKYGVEHPMQNPEVKQKVVDTNNERYGVPYVLQREDVFDKAHSEEAKEKIRQTNIERYGVPYNLSRPEVREKSFQTLVENAKLQKSKQEDDVYEIIHSIYPDTVRHHRTKEFPFVVDIYIPRFDLYIEYQGSHFHNRRAFLKTKKDFKELAEIIKKADEHRTEDGKLTQYDSIAYTWSDLDVRKREQAYELNLNYLEIYSFHNEDDIVKQLNNYLICLCNNTPFNYNDNALHSEFDYYSTLKEKSNITNISYISSRNSIIKHFQGKEFYKNEMYIYAHNPILRRKVIQNRIEYLEKKEYELNLNDVFRGFKISGTYYGYSHFNPSYTNWFVNHYNLTNIYDPCGGWGHHLLGMLNCEKIHYNDLNETVCENIKDMCSYFKLNNVDVHCGDATTYIPDDNNINGWFMCPPYYNLEIYNDFIYDSLDDYKEFLNKIMRNWKSSSAKIFGIIIREDFAELIDEKPSEVFKLKEVESNLTKNKKKYREYFYIFKK